MIKTYKGLLVDGGQDKIRLKTIKGEIGYRIVNFQLFPNGATSGYDYESFVSIWKVIQTTIPSDGAPDFSDSTLLGCGLYTAEANTSLNPEDLTVYFDKDIINQDIFVTHSNRGTGKPINYYIELEQVMLNDNQTTMATLQSLRQIAEK